jgi:hypothetical protein
MVSVKVERRFYSKITKNNILSNSVNDERMFFLVQSRIRLTHSRWQ